MRDDHADADRTSFGDPAPSARLKPEPHVGDATPEELRRVFAGYRALDDRSGGLYREFLRAAARCSRCREDTKVPDHQQPIPLLCGVPELADMDKAHAKLMAGHELLRRYRRIDPGVMGSLAFNPDDPAALPALTRVLHDAGLAGLSIGHCGWSDLTMRVRGDEMRDGTHLMILGNDWYPLAQCVNFLADRYEAGGVTLEKFIRLLLGAKKTPDADAVEGFMRRERVYLGNTLMRYRTGWHTTRGGNLSYRSFVNCREHLARHLAAVAPDVLVTFGENAASSAASVIEGVEPDDALLLGQLQHVHGAASLGKVMGEFGQTHGAQGIRGRIGDHELVFCPLYHPSYGHVNKYSGDYDALRAALGIGEAAPGRRRSGEPAPRQADRRCRAADISEIQLRRTGGLGPSPVYAVTLRRDGTAEWDGRDHVDRLGSHEGRFARGDFERLADAIVRLRFFVMADQYPTPATDLPSTITTVRWVGGDKTVDRSGDQGPAALWMLETLIDGVAASVRWKRGDQREAR